MWNFPLCLNDCTLIPTGDHPGAFGAKRKRFFHTGVDLYTDNLAIVSAVEDGIVIRSGPFTGPKLGHAHWEATDFLMIEGDSGVVNYGEISITHKCHLGFKVKQGDYIGSVKRVLPPDKMRDDIPGHKLSMLHIELYTHGTTNCFDWSITANRPARLLDPTFYLKKAYDSDTRSEHSIGKF